MSNPLDKFILRLKPEIGLSLKISFGVFLFILFFNPFPIIIADVNNLLLVASGFGFIMFIIIIIVKILSIRLFEGKKTDEEKIFPAYLNGLAVFIISSGTFILYALFVASVDFTFVIAFRIIIICLIPPVFLALNDSFRNQKIHIETLIAEKKKIQQQIEKFEEDILNRSVEFISENTNENLTLAVGDIIYIKSADNYVEIVFRDGDDIRKKLIRNTLRNIELQIKQYSNFVRCHRICIVNVHFIEKLQHNSNQYRLVLRGSPEELPVSRQYLLRLQESL